MGSPSTVTAPESACSTPMIMRMAVVLPAPLPPTNPVIMPGLMTKLMSVRTWWSPNDLLIPSSLITLTNLHAPLRPAARVRQRSLSPLRGPRVRAFLVPRNHLAPPPTGTPRFVCAVFGWVPRSLQFQVGFLVERAHTLAVECRRGYGVAAQGG